MCEQYNNALKPKYHASVKNKRQNFLKIDGYGIILQKHKQLMSAHFILQTKFVSWN